MNFITLVRIAKIAVTAALTAAPFLLLPIKRLAAMIGVDESAAPLLRLYGTTVLALLVGYTSGFWMIVRGEFP